ncbi:deoxyribodipyrimidine photo-lyase [Romeria aff. gracilis LEGE 07310]|uniref:Deoxyribodipyrimidine photo-lyase n=1 Tax=Vasconcelosia minhoensis LEGE 07310 TaxID=915328 RepID=A0A8J7AMK1_9CYAN|nr:FAD-binding domain-containing protein [Romeria gracilis]MBE9077071.1 deoxyribodipyrimidine photo-lyase [Romeria aff. gracilis LEGE 07310]
MADLVLFWHRRDLRLSDNLGLAAARDRSAKLIGLFCLDPGILEADDVAPARVAYMIGCLEALQDSYKAAGSELLILQDNPIKAIPKLAAALGAVAVYWNRDVEPYSRQRDTDVAQALKEKGIEMHTKTWDQLLHAPGEVRTQAGDPYTVYTPFWRNWIGQAKPEPVPAPSNLTGLSPKEKSTAKEAGATELPSAKTLGFTWDNGFLLDPGEAPALAQLENFCEDDREIAAYDQQRDFPAIPGTSTLSAAHKFGAIGIRTVWAAADAAYSRCRSDETHANVRVWQQELAWREFYQHVMYFFPELAEGPHREQLKDFPWDNDKDLFQAWCEGKTGYPIVDAAMRQLNQTGWMHNRCRMIVASFLSKDLIIDWRWGEKYFMQHLYDGDLSANNGGWQWSASSGMDPKPLRIFNPASQAKKYDPEAEYIREWLPEIRHLDTQMLVTGDIPAEELEGTGYPAAIVNHKERQAIFKARYSAQKDKVKR